MTSVVKKVVIPAAGMGTRFLPATKAQPKEMLAIQYVVEEAVACGITDILIITGRGKRSLEDHFDRSWELEYHLDKAGKHETAEEMRAIADMAEIHYVRQGEPRGLGHAVGVARHHVGDEPFVVMLGDDIMRTGVLSDMLDAFDHHGRSVIALREVPKEEISSYGCAAVEPEAGQLVRLRDVVEKPDPEDAPSNLAVMGRYIFTPEIFDVIDATVPGKGNEIQLTDAIRSLLGNQAVFGWKFVQGRFDIGNKLDYLRATVELALEREDVGPAFLEYLLRRLRVELGVEVAGP
jgi:UTP--glucose-1-phosphate uridylyltransferase